MWRQVLVQRRPCTLILLSAGGKITACFFVKKLAKIFFFLENSTYSKNIKNNINIIRKEERYADDSFCNA